MKLSELITLLEKTRERYGDGEVMGYSYEAAEAYSLESLDDIFLDRCELEDLDTYPENTFFVGTS